MRISLRILSTFTEKAWGLMFSKSVKTPLLFVFESSGRHGIHSFFCPPFDAVFLDENFRVVDRLAVRTLRFWIAPKSNARYLIEAAPGFAKRLKEGQAVRVSLSGAWLDLGS